MSGTVLIKIDPVGGYGGVFWDDGGQVDVSRIFICHGDSINSIQISYGDTLSDRHGGCGNKFDIVDLSSDLNWISGHYGNHMNGTYQPVVIRSLKFGTTDETFGPFGTEVGTPFSFQLGNSFGGFCGRSDNVFLYGIGVYVHTGATRYVGTAQLPSLTHSS